MTLVLSNVLALRKRLGPISQAEFVQLMRGVAADFCELVWFEQGKRSSGDLRTLVLEGLVGRLTEGVPENSGADRVAGGACVGVETGERVEAEASADARAGVSTGVGVGSSVGADISRRDGVAAGAERDEPVGAGVVELRSAAAVLDLVAAQTEEPGKMRSEPTPGRDLTPAVPAVMTGIGVPAEHARRNGESAMLKQKVLGTSRSPEVVGSANFRTLPAQPLDEIRIYGDAREAPSGSDLRIHFEQKYHARRFALENAKQMQSNDFRAQSVVKAKYSEAPYGEYFVTRIRDHLYCFPFWENALRDFWQMDYTRELFDLDEPAPVRPRLITPALVSFGQDGEWICHRRGRIGG
jgi:hypothetical protein